MTAATEHDLTDLLVRSIGPACHELRGPLAASYGFGKMLEARTDLDAAAARYVDHVVRGCERLDAMLDSLSQLGRVVAGRAHAERESVSVRACAEDAAALAPNPTQVTVGGGDEVHAHVDASWLERSLAGLVGELQYDPQIRVAIAWTHSPHDVSVTIDANDVLPRADMGVGASGINTALARAMVVAMGGRVETTGTGVCVILPRS